MTIRGFVLVKSAAGENFGVYCVTIKGFALVKSAAGENFGVYCVTIKGFALVKSAAGENFWYNFVLYFEEKNRSGTFLIVIIFRAPTFSSTILIFSKIPQHLLVLS